jgi:hypothetical protein
MVESSSQRGSYVITPHNNRPAVLEEGQPPMDFIDFMKNLKLVKLLDSNETLLFADKIRKYRALCSYKQDRTLAVTTCKVYNIKKN